MPRTLDVQDIIGQPDRLATTIANDYQTWDSYRVKWASEKLEIREYIFATDTSNTTNSVNPWKNSTHIPKLCQIRDNLHANYMAALFPNDRPIKWEGDDQNAEAKSKRMVIESYMENKLRLSGFRTEVSKIVLDYIDYGNCFGTIEFVSEKTVDPTTNEEIPGYIGPKLRRISPFDLVFDPTAASFAESPKIIRSLKTLGSLKADIDDHPEMGYLVDVFDKVIECRHAFQGAAMTDFKKQHGFAIDGFSSFLNYFQSPYVELLDFYGDIYDVATQTLQKNRLITIVDRQWVIRNEPNPSWLGQAPIFHAGWRLRPDNLYAMGPLDNLIGMQYRIDHLENAKADAFDLIVHPVMKVRGYVEDFEYGPGERIYVGDEGDVEFQAPDTTMLNADTQIAIYEAKMEEMAGAPKQAMGFRTPGEKTAYEVQILENGANRVFLNKTSYFEEVFIEPVINAMLETARRNMGVSDVIRVVDDTDGIVEFLNISKTDIAARGKIRPIGARHFARNANLIQNLTQLSGSALYQDPSINTHFSGLRMAELIQDALDIERYGIVQKNIRVSENMETQQETMAAQQVVAEEQAAGMDPNDISGMVQGPPQG